MENVNVPISIVESISINTTAPIPTSKRINLYWKRRISK
jgi:hypothetical protein